MTNSAEDDHRTTGIGMPLGASVSLDQRDLMARMARALLTVRTT